MTCGAFRFQVGADPLSGQRPSPRPSVCLPRKLAQAPAIAPFTNEPGGGKVREGGSMTRSSSTNLHSQPSLADLLVRFLATRSDAAAAAVEPAEGEVEPYEVAAGFRVDPRAAWADAVAVLQAAPVPTPSDWAALINQEASVLAVAMAAGNFPQRVKDLHPLLADFDPEKLRPSVSQVPTPGLSGL